MRLQLLARTGDRDRGGPAYALDVIQFWVPAPAHPTNVVVAAETPCLDGDVAFAESIGAIAATLEFPG